MDRSKLRFAMYPWFAMGHLTSFLHLSNKLAGKGHSIFFIHPTNTLPKLEKYNLHPQLINYIAIKVPHVEGLPHGAETTSDIPITVQTLLWQALDLTKDTILDSLLQELKPHFVIYDFAYWIPSLARKYGVKSIHYCSIPPSSLGYLLRRDRSSTEDELMEPPPGFPAHSSIKLHRYEARMFSPSQGEANDSSDSGKCKVSFTQRMFMAFQECDVIAFKTCQEIEGPYCEFIKKKFEKPVILAGPILPETNEVSNLDEQWAKWLKSFKELTVIFCAFGSECRLTKDQFQELVLGLEFSGFPFFAALKPPFETETIEEVLPQGFIERTKGKAIVHGGWVEQQLILSHPSVGCFVTHCGGNSLSEGMINECQLVLIPQHGDQFINARLFGGELKVGVEVDRGEDDGIFTKEGVSKAIRLVMDDCSEAGKQVRANHAKFREFLLSKELEDSYIDGFAQKLQTLL